MTADEEWYGVRLIYRCLGFTEPAYEERIVILKAADDAGALAKAEELSKSHEDETTVYVGYAIAYLIADESGDADALRPGTEVFSLMRKSSLPPEEYLNRFHDTGDELTR